MMYVYLLQINSYFAMLAYSSVFVM